MNPNPSESNGATQKKYRIKIPRSIKRQFEQPSMIKVGRITWRQIQIATGALIASFGFAVFQVPFKLAAGGITGLGIILNNFIPIPVGMTYLLLNIPLLFLGYFQLGRWRFVLSTVVAVFCLSISIPTTLLINF